MQLPRHRSTADRPDRPDRRGRSLRLVLPVSAAALVSATVVGVTVARSGPASEPADHVAAKPIKASVPAAQDSIDRAERRRAFSRSAQRVTLVVKPKVTDHLFRTAPLNLWPAPREKGKPLQVLPRGGKVAVTGVRKAGFAQILFAGQVRWVHADFLAHAMPKPPKPPKHVRAAQPAKSAKSATRAKAAKAAPASRSKPAPSAGGSSAPAGGGVTSAPCPDGSGTESGLTSAAVTLFRSVCNAFPALSSYGGYDAHGEHSSGKAIDFMINGNSALGQAVANWARAHAAQLNLYDVIWAQHIWTPVRAAEGWRAMPDRGSPTANHYDHVHISVN